MKRTLWIDSRAGISSDRMVAALIGLGAPEREILRTIKSAAEEISMLDVHTHIEFLPDETLAHRLHISPLAPPAALALEDRPNVLERALSRTGVKGVYANFARRAHNILCAVERQGADSVNLVPEQTVSLSVIGTAHTPYKHKAPYQPKAEHVNDGAFYIQIAPQYAAGTQALETFSHIFVLSYLDRSLVPEITVQPPWKNDPKRYGAFATRSPNRPSPIGLTRARLLSIEGDRIYTGPLDLFDGTPILDIKPFVRSLDGMVGDSDSGNDGWLEGSDHLELHRLGVPHEHPHGTSDLSLPALEVALLVGMGWGLQYLEIDLTSVMCVSPVNTGPKQTLALSAQAILDQHEIPNHAGSDTGELISPVGAAILAALTPEFATSDDLPADPTHMGLGLGQHIVNAAPPFGALRLLLVFS
jgi:tRNA-Thr(GGU) m(6)t(6)A37 methyltransferase TsaA